MTRERGSVSVELVLLTPVLLLLLGLVVMTGRIGETRIGVGHAAQQAARAASLAGDPLVAQAQAHATAAANLDTLGVVCGELTVDLDTTRFAPGGDVTVAVTCTVDLSDVSFAGIPGQRILQADAIEVIDRYRADPS